MFKKFSTTFLFILLMSISVMASAQVNVSKDGITKVIREDESQTIELMEYDSYPDENLPALDTPKNLQWNVDASGEKHNGYVSWETVENCEGQYYVVLYRDGEEVYTMNWHDLYDDGSGKVSIDFVHTNIFDTSGTYTFSVRAIGDWVKYNNSKDAFSGEYKFVAPSQKLKIPNNIFWAENGVIKHKAVPNTGWYNYTVYDRDKRQVGNTWVHPRHDEDGYMSFSLKDYLVEISTWTENFTAAYVTVTALSDDIEIYQNSDESTFSPRYDIVMQQVTAGNVLNKAMESLYNGEKDAKDTLDNLLTEMGEQNISNADLAISMATDSELVDAFAELENILCEEEGITVSVENSSADASYLEDKGINPQEISVIGAALNSDESKDVSISFSKADESLSVDESFYKNSVAVEINIDGVKNSGDLDVPIQMTMPVPEGVLPERFIILHYQADGKIEKIRPALKYESGKYYASFLLTSFSPFVFCNEDISISYNNIEREVTIFSNVQKENVTLIIAAYRGGRMVSMASEFISSLTEGELSLNFWDFDTSRADKVKIMIWENGAVLKPYIDAVELTNF